VYTYSAGLAPGAPAPSIILNNLSALLAPCAHLSPPCVETSTFHGTYSPDGATIAFAFRNWDQFGDGVGSQGIAVASADGSNVVVLTYNTSGPDGGLEVFDTCPTPTADASRIFFFRSDNQGSTTFPAVVDVATRAVTVLGAFPQFADASGCANYLPGVAGGYAVMYMGCVGSADECGFEAAAGGGAAGGGAAAAVAKSNHRARWGLPGAPAAGRRRRAQRAAGGAPSPFSYYTVAMPPGSSPASWAPSAMFVVPLTDTPDTIDSYAVTQCDAIRGLGGSSPLSCEGSDPKRSFFARLFVDPATGKTSAESDTFKACMGPRCTLMLAA
jgi:hypothetical protein